MKKTFAAALFATTLAGLGAASAMPLAPVNSNSTPPADVIQVAQGCGPGWARGPYGRCRPMGAAVYVAPAPVVVVPRARVCPPGFFWAYGRCRPV